MLLPSISRQNLTHFTPSAMAVFYCLISAAGSTWHCRHPGAPAVIGLTRLYCNQGERFLLIDVASEEASKRAEELLNDGWEIEAAIPV